MSAQANLFDAPGSCDRACLTGGLVFGLSMFRHPMEEKVFESVHVFRIQGGRIHDIEAMGISLPYKSTNGWSGFWR